VPTWRTGRGFWHRPDLSQPRHALSLSTFECKQLEQVQFGRSPDPPLALVAYFGNSGAHTASGVGGVAGSATAAAAASASAVAAAGVPRRSASCSRETDRTVWSTFIFLRCALARTCSSCSACCIMLSNARSVYAKSVSLKSTLKLGPKLQPGASKRLAPLATKSEGRKELEARPGFKTPICCRASATNSEQNTDERSAGWSF